MLGFEACQALLAHAGLQREEDEVALAFIPQGSVTAAALGQMASIADWVATVLIMAGGQGLIAVAGRLLRRPPGSAMDLDDDEASWHRLDKAEITPEGRGNDA